MLFFNFSGNIVHSVASDTEEFNFDDIDALLSDLDIIDKQHKVMLDNSGSHSANCDNDNDEVMEVVEDFTTDPKLLISETEGQENSFFNLPDEKANVTSVNENKKVAPLLGRLPPLNLKKAGGIIADRKLVKKRKISISWKINTLILFSN